MTTIANVHVLLLKGIVGVLLFGFVFCSSSDAELVVRRIDVVLDGTDYVLDLDQNGTNDFVISDSGPDSSTITTANNSARVFGRIDKSSPLLAKALSTVDGSLGDQIQGQLFLYGADGSPFDAEGTTGFIGLSLVIEETETTNFGFLEITRGSTILGAVGYQTQANVGATITIPEPATGMVFVGGLFGAMLRRKK